MVWIVALTAVLALIYGFLANRQLRKKLRRSESRLRRVFEANMIGLSISDHQGNITEANDYFLNLMGANPQLLKAGRLNWRDFTSPDSLEKSMTAVQELKEKGFTEPFEKEYLRPDGTKVPALVAAARVDDGSNIGFILDLSSIKLSERLSQSEQFLDSIIEFIPNMIFVKDAKDLRFVRFNRAGEELVGQPRTVLIGKSDYDFFPKDEADAFVEKDRAVLRNKMVVDIPEEPISTSRGMRFLHTKKIPVFDKDGVPQYLIGISEDITEKKLAEQQKLALLHAQAAREEAEKSAGAMSLLSVQANEANRAKSAFLANISHEIRTPLGAMLGFAELALETSAPDKKSEYVRTILRNGNELLRIVDEVLDLSKAESNSMDIENIRFSLPDLLKDLEGLMKVRALQKNLELQFHTEASLPRFVSSDPFRIRQILLNVVGNAIKFTEHGHVSVSASYKDGLLKFIVSDTGIGIPPAQAERLFRPFTQADDSTTRKFGGTGLGLFLSRKLAQLLGGDVALLQSLPGEGSRFEITMKVSSDVSQESPTPPAKASDERPAGTYENAKVLVVDDSEDNQDLLAAFMMGTKIEVQRAGRGSQAVEIADDSYSLILMDIQMPEMDGFEALRLIRKKGVKVPVVAVTAHAMKGDRERCLAGGFDGYLSKPISKKSLGDCLRDFL